MTDRLTEIRERLAKVKDRHGATSERRWRLDVVQFRGYAVEDIEFLLRIVADFEMLDETLFAAALARAEREVGK